MSRRTAFAALAAELAKPMPDGPNGEKQRRWYIWGTDGPDTFDCSGFIAYCLLMVGGPDWRKSWWTERMWKQLPIITKPQPGDLCLYGWPIINHVMVWMADGCVIGASGGNKTTTTIEIARHQNAFVKKHTSHEYRKDFRGYRKLEPLDKQEGGNV